MLPSPALTADLPPQAAIARTRRHRTPPIRICCQIALPARLRDWISCDVLAPRGLQTAQNMNYLERHSSTSRRATRNFVARPGDRSDGCRFYYVRNAQRGAPRKGLNPVGDGFVAVCHLRVEGAEGNNKKYSIKKKRLCSSARASDKR